MKIQRGAITIQLGGPGAVFWMDGANGRHGRRALSREALSCRLTAFMAKAEISRAPPLTFESETALAGHYLCHRTHPRFGAILQFGSGEFITAALSGESGIPKWIAGLATAGFAAPILLTAQVERSCVRCLISCRRSNSARDCIPSLHAGAGCSRALSRGLVICPKPRQVRLRPCNAGTLVDPSTELSPENVDRVGK